MKYIPFILGLLCTKTIIGQNEIENGKNITFSIGGKVRATTIYPNRFPNSVPLPAVNAFEQPGKHIDGPGVEIAEGITLTNSTKIVLTQGVRYDYIYQRFPLEQIPPPDFQYTVKRKIIYDLLAEVEKKIQSSHVSYFLFSCGGGIYGINTGFYLTERYYQTATDYTEQTKKKTFIFPAVFIGASWRYKTLQPFFRVGYCWDDPTLLNSPFLFPEIGFKYNFLSLPK